MSTYRKIHGRSIQAITTDPTESVAEGQVWYNTTSDTFKSIVASEAWSSASPLATGRYLTGGFGTPTAGVISTGQAPPHYDNTEHYNGSGWSSETAYPAPGYAFAGAGTQTAGLAAGGNYPSSTRVTTSNTYNGTSWTATGSLPVAADNLSFCGNTRTGAIGAVGRTPSTGNAGTNTSVVYDGSSFSSGPNLNTARMYGNAAGSGTGTAGLIWGGFIDPSPNSMTNTEEYDGSSWTNGGSLNTASSFPSGFGTQTDTVCQVNSPNYEGSEKYDGTSWTALPNIGIASPGGLYGNKAFSPTGTSSGYITSMSPTSAATAEWNVSVNVITAGAWASGGALNNATRGGAGIGTRDAAVAAGGITGSPNPAGPGRPGLSEEYNGTAWSNLPTIGRSPTDSTFILGGNGTSTAGLIAGGMPGAQGQVANADEWDGSSWTAANAMSTARQSPENIGVQTAAYVTGGRNDPGPVMNTVEAYDGTNWTSGTAMSTARYYHSAGGTTSSGWVAGGSTPSAIATTEEWNGSSWTASNDLVTTNYAAAHGGPQTSAFVAGGKNPTDMATTQHYNGTIWATAPSISAARSNVFGSPNVADNSTGLIAGGTPAPPNTTATEEFTGETTSLNIETLTQS